MEKQAFIQQLLNISEHEAARRVINAKQSNNGEAFAQISANGLTSLASTTPPTEGSARFRARMAYELHLRAGGESVPVEDVIEGL